MIAALVAYEATILQHSCEMAAIAAKWGIQSCSKPCPYCKRLDQKPGRTSCDGCGAPR